MWISCREIFFNCSVLKQTLSPAALISYLKWAKIGLVMGSCVIGKEDKVEERKPFCRRCFFASFTWGWGGLCGRQGGYKEMSIYFGDITPYFTYGGSPPSRMWHMYTTTTFFLSLFSTFYCAEANVKRKCISHFCKCVNFSNFIRFSENMNSEYRISNLLLLNHTYITHLNSFLFLIFRGNFSVEWKLLTFALNIRFCNNAKKKNFVYNTSQCSAFSK